MAMRGIRGATTVEENTKEAIRQSVQELVAVMMEGNGVGPEDIGAAIFSGTGDITAGFPATAMRQMPGMEAVPLFDAQEMDVEGSLPLCIRLLLLADTDKSQRDVTHVYLRGAGVLRPDLCG